MFLAGRGQKWAKGVFALGLPWVFLAACVEEGQQAVEPVSNESQEVAANVDESALNSPEASEGVNTSLAEAAPAEAPAGADNFAGITNGTENATAAQETTAAPVDAGPSASASPGFAPSSTGGLVTGQAGVPAAPGLPELGSKIPYVVRAGDTLGKIASKVYGNPGRYKELAQLSNLDDPDIIFPGDVIYYQLTAEALAFATQDEPTVSLASVVEPSPSQGTVGPVLGATDLDYKALSQGVLVDVLADVSCSEMIDLSYEVAGFSLESDLSLQPESELFSHVLPAQYVPAMHLEGSSTEV